jgi:hypothetical protein
VTEPDWLSCLDPHRMLQLLYDRQAGDRCAAARKWRLFACACVRRLGPLLEDRRARETLLLSERFAEGQTGRRQLSEALRAAQAQERSRWMAWQGAPRREQPWRVALAIAALAKPAATDAAWESANAVAAALKGKERVAQSALLREVFGNPFRPPAPTSWARWNDGAIVHLAASLYDEQRWSELPVLADALEDAGCTDLTVLAHCREGGEHVRGCWVLDWVLNKQ